MDNLHRFISQSELSDYIENQYKEPFVAEVTGDNSSTFVKYNLKSEEKPSIEEIPLTFVITRVGNVKWVSSDESFAKTIEYSKDNGTTWNPITSTTEGVSISVNAGDVVQFRGNNTTYGQSITQYNSFDSSDCEFYVMGNIMSLIDSVNYATVKTLSSGYTFYGLFENCHGLKDVSDLVLPATALTDYCYAFMFYDCVNLGKIEISNVEDLYYTIDVNSVKKYLPSLPAQVLAAYCYKSMFANCTQITSSPSLSALTLMEGSYMQMFSGCTSLNYIEFFATNISATSALTNWVYGVAPQGLFIKESSMTALPENSPHGIPSGWEVRGELTCLLFEILSDGVINWKTTNANFNKTIEYSKDYGTTWSSITATRAGVTIPVSEGDMVYFRGDNPAYGVSTTGFCTFYGTDCEFNLKGNIMSLIDSENYESLYTLNTSYTFTALFSGCTNLQDSSELLLPATSVSSYAYYLLFKECKAMTHGPELPATVLRPYCYQDLFSNCWKLVEAPKLNAPILADSCYRGMFQFCTGLTTAPVLSAETLVNNCYRFMFNSCTRLTRIEMLAKNGVNSTDCFLNWVQNVSRSGTFVKYSAVDIPINSVNGVPEGWTIIRKEAIQPLTFTITSPGNIVWKTSSSSSAKTVEYSKDFGETWTSITATTSGVVIPVVSGETIQFRGDNTTYSNSSGTVYNHFSGSTCGFKLEGNIMSLIDSTLFPTMTSIQSPYTFLGLFMGCSGLTDAEDLVIAATTLANYCYSAMFSGCTSLTTPPFLVETPLAEGCYSSMFAGCISLSTPPVLSTTLLAAECYSGMFEGCTSLTSAPELCATTLANACYRAMFKNCVGLTETPELTATILAPNCYEQMFQGCTSLTTAPNLPSQSLPNYCYSEMFKNCTALTYIKCSATENTGINCTHEWVSNVASSGTFAKITTMTAWTIDSVDGIPVGWTVINDGIVLSTNTMAFDLTGGTSSIIVTSSANWTANTDSNWITISPLTGGTGETNVEFTVSLTETTRNGSVVFTDGVNTQTLEVRQYNKFIEIPLTFDVLTSGTIIWKALGSNQTKTISYSKDNGETWSSITSTSAGVAINVSAGDKVLFKGNNSKYAADKNNYSGFQGGTATYNIEGNIMSLVAGDNFMEATSFSDTFVFCSLFKLSNAVSAKNLILPVMTLTEACYRAMFSYATALTEAPIILPATTLARDCYWYMFEQSLITKAPELPATTLMQGSYGNMFKDCVSLNYIKCMATNISAPSGTTDWVSNVASTGTFVKSSSMSLWTVGKNGIPTGWVVYNDFPVDSPVIYCVDDEVTITCDTDGASVYYRFNQAGNYALYSGPLRITADTIVEAYAEKGINQTNVTIQNCTYMEHVYKFAGLEFSTGPLYYGANGYEIKDSWNYDSYNSAYSKNNGSTYFNFIEMGELFDNTGFTASDGNILNMLDPLDGWRLPTTSEWQSIIGTTRSGSTVNNTTNKHYALLQLTGVTHAGSTTPYGLLVFPDGESITGVTLSYMDNTNVNRNITEAQLNVYLNQGCVFLPLSGYRYNDGWHNTGSRYMSSTEYTTDDSYMLAFGNNSINPGNIYGKNTVHATVRLVKNADYGEETPFESSNKDINDWIL